MHFVAKTNKTAHKLLTNRIHSYAQQLHFDKMNFSTLHKH